MNNIKNAITGIKGQFVSLKWHKTCSTYKNVTENIEKETQAHSVRIGAQYENMQAVKEGRENGNLPSENTGLRGLEWEVYPYILKNPKTGKEFLRIETTEASTFSSEFFMDGQDVDKESILDKLTANEKKSNDTRPIVMNIPLENILEINCKALA